MTCCQCTCGILKSGHGIAEIVLRGTILLLTLIMAGTAGGVLGIMEQIINNSGFESIIPRAPTDAAAGWLIFMAVVIMLFEVFFITQRFINIKAINDHITIVIIVDIIFNFVCAALIFCAAVALATYLPQFRNTQTDLIHFLVVDLVTTIVSFLNIIVLVALGIFMILGGLILKWGATKAKYDISSGASGAV